MLLLLNAFSLSMVAAPSATITCEDLTLTEAQEVLTEGPWESAVGHVDTAAVFAEQLGVPVAADRRSVVLATGQPALVGQYQGPRLPEGATALPEGATIRWLLVRVEGP